MTEPRFVRIRRPSKQAVVPHCARCDRPLERLRKRWCSNTCQTYAWRWRRALREYLEKHYAR